MPIAMSFHYYADRFSILRLICFLFREAIFLVINLRQALALQPVLVSEPQVVLVFLVLQINQVVCLVVQQGLVSNQLVSGFVSMVFRILHFFSNR